MTSKVYRTAQGKTVDLGTIMLQNEHVRAVGNMNVNARGDKLDHNNQVIETKPRQIQRQNARTTNVSADPVQTSATKSKRAKKEKAQAESRSMERTLPPAVEETPVAVTAPPAQNIATPGKIPEGGLAAAIARQREVKQELEKTRRQQQQAHGVRKI
jgi:ribosomal protein L9